MQTFVAEMHMRSIQEHLVPLSILCCCRKPPNAACCPPPPPLAGGTYPLNPKESHTLMQLTVINVGCSIVQGWTNKLHYLNCTQIHLLNLLCPPSFQNSQSLGRFVSQQLHWISKCFLRNVLTLH